MMNRMSRAVLFATCIVISLFYSPVSWADEHPWKLRLDRGGIQVYTRPVNGAAILEFKANTIINAPIDQVIAGFEDVKKMPSWFHQCVAAEVLKDEDDQNKIAYIVLDLPWPVTTRDSVFRITKSVDKDTGSVVYLVAAVPGLRPNDPARIRVPYLKGMWRFFPRGDRDTEASFEQHSDPGGFIPAFLANSLVVDIPYNSLLRLRDMITQEIK